MILEEQSAVSTAVLPVTALRDHLRLSAGFADDAVQDAALERILRAAFAAAERRTGKALLARQFLVRLTGWRDPARQVLPLAPVGALVSAVLRDGAGAVLGDEAPALRLVSDTHFPALVPARGTALPCIPAGGVAEIAFEAGFGADWAAVPGDLAQAVLILAAWLYDGGADGLWPPAAAALAGPHIAPRLSGGAR